MKRLAAGLLTLVLALGLAACSPDDSGGPGASGAAATPELLSGAPAQTSAN